MKKILIALLFVVAFGHIQATYAQDLIIYTEEFPPFNFTKNGKITGVSTEIVHRIMVDTGFRYQIKSLPWNEAYDKTQKDPNTLIFSISRRPDREKLFKWIDILTPTTYSALTLKARSEIKIKDLQDLANYKIGTTKDDVVESWLIGKGFSQGDLVRTSGDNAAMKNFKNLLNNRIDVWPFPDAVAYYIVRQEGHSKPDLLLNKAFAIEELSGGFHMAASLKTPDSVVSKIANSLRKFKKTDEYFKILAHWGVDAMGLKTTDPISKLLYSLKYFSRIVKVGYLATDKLSAHREGGLYRKEMREEFVEKYAKNYEQWRNQFIEIQNSVDVLIIGSVEGIKGWNAADAKTFVKENTKVPTGCMVEGLAHFALISYENESLVINSSVADQLGISFPKSYLRIAARVIE